MSSARIELHPELQPELKPVSGPTLPSEDDPLEPRRSYGRTAVVLSIALSLVVAGWVLSEVQQGRAVRNLELQIQTLESQLEQKNRALSAHEQRLDEVRDRVQTLQQLLDTPVLTPPQ